VAAENYSRVHRTRRDLAANVLASESAVGGERSGGSRIRTIAPDIAFASELVRKLDELERKYDGSSR